MQARAIFEAAIEVEKKTGEHVRPEIMIPLVAFRREFDILADVIRATAKTVAAETGAKLDYEIGTMIELPRAALRAEELAEGDNGAAFFSFGTNDLTQTALGLSRDDAAPILLNYSGRGIFDADPFVSIDQDGVGELRADRCRAWPQRQAEAQARHLRRARRRSRVGRVFPSAGIRLRLMLAVPRPDRAPRRSSGGHQRALSRQRRRDLSVDSECSLRGRKSRGRADRAWAGADAAPGASEGRGATAPAAAAGSTRHPERIVAVLHPGQEAREHRCGDGRSAQTTMPCSMTSAPPQHRESVGAVPARIPGGLILRPASRGGNLGEFKHEAIVRLETPKFTKKYAGGARASPGLFATDRRQKGVGTLSLHPFRLVR